MNTGLRKPTPEIDGEEYEGKMDGYLAALEAKRAIITLEILHGKLNVDHCVNILVDGRYTVSLFGKGTLTKTKSGFTLCLYSPGSNNPCFVHNITNIKRELI